MLAPLLLACGTILLVISFGLGARGAALRRFALMLVALPFVATVLFGALRSIGAERGSVLNGFSIAIASLVLMIVAYMVVDLRSRLKGAKQDARVREKRPIDASSREPNLLSLLRDELRGEDDEQAASWAWGVKTHEITRFALRAMIESEAVQTLVELPQFLLIPNVRERVLATASQESRDYFENRFGPQEQQYVSAVLNKLEPFLGSVAVQRFLGQPEPVVDLFAAMQRGETVLVNLAKGYLGPPAEVMGRLLVNVFQLAALRREETAPEKRAPYALLLDEAHVLAGAESGLEEFLVAARKYKVFVTLAAQGLSLFPSRARPHLLGNTGRQFFFRLPFSEAKQLAPDIFEPLGSVWREQIRPTDAIDDPLLTPAEEIAWRTRELASLPIGACYWYAKDRPYKARRIAVLPPLVLPFTNAKLARALENEMARKKGLLTLDEPEVATQNAIARAIAERSARRAATAGIVEDAP